MAAHDFDGDLFCSIHCESGVACQFQLVDGIHPSLCCRWCPLLLYLHSYAENGHSWHIQSCLPKSIVELCHPRTVVRLQTTVVYETERTVFNGLCRSAQPNYDDASIVHDQGLSDTLNVYMTISVCIHFYLVYFLIFRSELKEPVDR